MSSNRKRHMTAKVRATLKALFKRQRYFEAYGVPGFSILKGRKPGMSTLMRFDADGNFQGTSTGRIRFDQPELHAISNRPQIANNMPIQSIIAESYNYADLEKRVAAMLGCEVSEIGQSVIIDRG